MFHDTHSNVYNMFLCFLLQTWREYEDYYKNNSMLLARTSDNLRDIRDSAFMFDAAWTAALAINRTASRLSSSGIALENFTYDGQHSRNISRTLYEEALKVSFFGLTVSEAISIYSYC